MVFLMVLFSVCQIANKNCRFSADVYTNCWDSYSGQSQQGGVGLYGGYYDACTGKYKMEKAVDFID